MRTGMIAAKILMIGWTAAMGVWAMPAQACQTDPNTADKDGKHLFILSGQSNMAGLDPNLSFSPTVAREFGAENVVVVKDAKGGEPIRRWFKKWQAEGFENPQPNGDLYDRLMAKVNVAIKGQNLQSVTLVWMQGERDAREKFGDVYQQSLAGLVEQISDDLQWDDVNCVVGRLSDFDMENNRYPHWTRVREAQVEFAQSSPHFGWVDTDDLNDGLNRRGQPSTTTCTIPWLDMNPWADGLHTKRSI